MRPSIVVLGSLTVAACGRIGFGDTPVPGDGQLDECLPSSPAEDFTSMLADPCAPWGSPTVMQGLDVVRAGGGLEITPQDVPGTMGQFGGCNFDVPDITRGAMVEVSSVLDAAPGYTNMVFYWGVPLGDDLLVKSFGLQVGGWDRVLFALAEAGHQGHRPYDPIATRFWRILVDDAAQLRAQVSPDGWSWADVATHDTTGEDVSRGWVTFGAGRDDDLVTGTARFESLNVCPSGPTSGRR